MADAKQRTQYWASIEDHEQLLSAIDERIKNYYDDVEATGLMDVWERCYRAYYGGRITGGDWQTSLFQGSSLKRGGKQGEKTILKVNHFRNFVQHFHQLATSQKPVTQCMSANTDSKSQAQTILGNGLVDYYWREKSLGRYLKDAAELAVGIYGEGFVYAPWDPTAGKVYEFDQNGMPIYEGDQEYRVLNPMDTIRDPALKTANDHDWYITRTQENRWNLAAKYKALAEEIISASPFDPNNDDHPSFQLRGGRDPVNDDIVTLHTLLHRRTEAMPEGRLVIFLKEVVLFDGPIPYPDQIPVYRVSVKDLNDTIYGYTFAYDLLGIQEGMDELNTIIMSNNKAFGTQSIWTQRGDGLTVKKLTGGMKHLQSDVKPEGIQLTQTAKETFDYLQLLERFGETLSGIPSVVRGQPESSLKSGAALALVVSQAIQYASSFEESYFRLVGDVATGLIQNLKTFSQTERVVEIIGVASRPYAKTFKAEDLSEINRVTVEPASPLSKTFAGRIQLADSLLEKGLIENAKQYVMVLSTGQLDPAIEGTQHALLNVRAENEEMREGRPVPVIITDNHPMHIVEHASVLSSPEARRNPELIRIVTDHLLEHLEQWRQMPPELGLALNIPPAMPSMPPAGPGMAPEVMDSTQPVVEQAEGVNLPNMPDLPEEAPMEAQQAYEKTF